MTTTREALQRVAAGKRVTKHQLVELLRDGHIDIDHDGVITITTTGATILNERN